MPLLGSNAHAFARTFCETENPAFLTRQCLSGARFITSGLIVAPPHDSPTMAKLFLLLISSQLPYLLVFSIDATFHA